MVTTAPIFHRGVVLDAKEENTMPAFKAAASRGRGFECDIHPSADETFVVIHDGTWDRTTPYTGRVSDTPQSKIDNYKTNGGADIPSLWQALSLTDDGAAPVLIDIKTADNWSDDALRRLDELVVTHGAELRCFVFTDEKDLIARLRQLCPNTRVSYRPVDVGYSLEQTLEMGCSAIQPTLDTLTQNRVDAFQAEGLRVIVQSYSIDNEADLNRARNLGVNYVLIDAAKWDRWT